MLATRSRYPTGARPLLIEETARENLAEARALVAAFSPVPLASGTLVDALERLVERFARETGIRVDLQLAVDADDMTRLPPHQQVVVLRSAQEALANIRKHAQARQVHVQLDFQPDVVCLAVDDDGRGFEVPAVLAELAQHGHFGLLGMQERVWAVGGSLSVESAPGQGTRVRARLPVGQARLNP